MNAKSIIESLATRKGQHVLVTWKRPMETRKDITSVVEKQTSAFVRSGIEYSNLASVREGVASGERDEVQPLPTWCEWVSYPFILRHKDKGTEYVRLYPASFRNLAPSPRYFIDGKEASADAVKPLCLAKEFRERDESPACFMVKADSVVNIAD